jgi:tripartite-type tricarboxylate transporter receptor subunit TctC
MCPRSWGKPRLFNSSLSAPDMRERLASLDAQPMTMTPAEFDRFVRSQMEDAAEIVKAARISAQ